MKSHIIDTNCLISYVKNKNANQFEIMSQIFEETFNLERKIIITAHVLSEFVYVLEDIYWLEKRIISNMLNDLLDSPGIEFNSGYYPETIFRLWPGKNKDYGDAVLAACAFNLNISLLTFDRRFSTELKKSGINHLLL